jgi:hypothetical protein
MPPLGPLQVIAPVVMLRVSGVVALTAKVPHVLGSVRDSVPATACGVILAVPLLPPANPNVPVTEVGMPSTGVNVALGAADDVPGVADQSPAGNVGEVTNGEIDPLRIGAGASVWRTCPETPAVKQVGVVVLFQ